MIPQASITVSGKYSYRGMQFIGIGINCSVLVIEFEYNSKDSVYGKP